MVQFHRQNRALATLAVQDRETSRYLLFDDAESTLRPATGTRSGSQKLSDLQRRAALQAAKRFRLLRCACDFSAAAREDDRRGRVLDHYFVSAACGEGEKIVAFHADEYYWRDLGTAENVKQASREVEQGVVRI